MHSVAILAQGLVKSNICKLYFPLFFTMPKAMKAMKAVKATKAAKKAAAPAPAPAMKAMKAMKQKGWCTTWLTSHSKDQ